MSHELEFVNGQASMAYVGELPWHGLGKQVPADLTPAQMLDAAGLNWRVEKEPCYADLGGKRIDTGHSVLYRDSDNKVLDVITDDWNPCQNEDAFAFFNDFIAKGDMEMHTAGSLKDGRIVWALAKIKDSSFDLFGGKDQVDAYLHFTNPHSYGQSIDIRFTPIRVVCNNTLTLSLNMKSKNFMKVSHRREFNGDEVKLALGISAEKLATYKEAAEYLASKRYNNETVVDYFKRVFPLMTNDPDKKDELSRNAKLAVEDYLDGQVGAELGEGSWWQAFNAVTYMTDHVIGRNADNRLQSAWYGSNKNLKVKALETALDFAEVA
jgi:phage/plasmid-like protein (TIGR03299 family)